jgi:hypothetical protein
MNRLGRVWVRVAGRSLYFPPREQRVNGTRVQCSICTRRVGTKYQQEVLSSRLLSHVALHFCNAQRRLNTNLVIHFTRAIISFGHFSPIIDKIVEAKKM